MNFRDAKIIIRHANRVLDENPEIEWYSGGESHTHPVRIKINGIWEHVFHYEKIVREDSRQQREIVFRCHIGDNRIIETVISQAP